MSTDNQASSKSNAAETSPETIPNSPQNLIVLELNFDYVYIIWDDVSELETAFIIERHSEEDDYVNHDTLDADATDYIDYQVDPNTYYYYRVKAFNPNGESAPSNEASGQTYYLPYSPPRSPSSVQGRFSETNYITLTWDDKSDNEEVFNIYRGKTLNTIQFIDSLDANSTMYIDYSIESEQTYYYFVAASNDFGVSIPTDTIGVQVKEVLYLASPVTKNNYGHNAVYNKVNLSPNPATEHFRIAISDPGKNSEITEKYYIRIINQYGQIVDDIEVSDHLSGQPFDINIAHLRSGTYSVNLYNKNSLIDAEKLLIIR